MSTGQGVNVLRYSALLVGVFYGFSHQRALNADARAFHAQQEWSNKEDLIKKAKKAWAEKQIPADQRNKGDGVITNPDDKNFDLEAYLKKVEAES